MLTNVHNFLKNVQNYVHLTYTNFQFCTLNIYKFLKNCTKFVHSTYTKFSKNVPNYVYLMYPKIQICTKFCTFIVVINFQVQHLIHYCCATFVVLLVRTSEQVTMYGKTALYFALLSLACCYFYITWEIFRCESNSSIYLLFVIFYLMLGSQLYNYKAERQWFLNRKNETP